MLDQPKYRILRLSILLTTGLAIFSSNNSSAIETIFFFTLMAVRQNFNFVEITQCMGIDETYHEAEGEMKKPTVPDAVFYEAVDAIDTGNLSMLKEILNKYPDLTSKRLEMPDTGYFKQPYLLWFIANNPIRQEICQPNISVITKTIIDEIKTHAPTTLQEQLDYTLGLVATGRIPRESGVQIALIDLLIDEGAKPGNANGAITHGNLGAARRLIERGGQQTLSTAICLEQDSEILRLIKKGTTEEKQIGLVVASFYGKPDIIKLLIENGVDVNVYLDHSSGFHYHATALHQAVFSGSLESVKLLVEAGADLQALDRVYQGTPLGWAKYMQTEAEDEDAKKRYKLIENYLEHI